MFASFPFQPCVEGAVISTVTRRPCLRFCPIARAASSASRGTRVRRRYASSSHWRHSYDPAIGPALEGRRGQSRRVYSGHDVAHPASRPMAAAQVMPQLGEAQAVPPSPSLEPAPVQPGDIGLHAPIHDPWATHCGHAEGSGRHSVLFNTEVKLANNVFDGK